MSVLFAAQLVLPWFLAIALYIRCGRLAWRNMRLQPDTNPPMFFIVLWLPILALAWVLTIRD